MLTHAMTIDVEDYYQVAAFFDVIASDDWSRWPSRVSDNTQKLLDIFCERNLKATFFILGKVAEEHPELVKRIAHAGHEIASHGYSHRFVYEQTPSVFRDETLHSKKLLEDLTGQAIKGYRAASYSITRHSLWALEVLAEAEFTWDSSIFPTRHDNYGIPNSPHQPYEILTPQGSLIEFPLTTAKVLGLSLPAAGGGYFRQYPYPLSRWLFNRASQHQTQPQIFYLHPWELDPDQPRIPNASWFSRFRHYTNLDKTESRLKQLMTDFPFGTMSESLASVKIEQKLTLDQLK